MKQALHKGSIVKYQTGWMRVTAAFKDSVNLGPIFGGSVKVKHVPLSEVQEDHDNWFKHWQQSETYQCM